jgi:hypothetical protein
MSEDPCTCPVTDRATWVTYGDAVEPGSQRQWDPDCPEHGDPDRPTTAPLTRCPECGDVNGFHKTGCENAPVEYGGDSKRAATFHDGSES